MFENIMKFFNKVRKKEQKTAPNSKEAAKERLHLVLMQDRANVSADFLELMKQEIIEVIKKYIDIDERAIDVRLTNKENEDGTNGAPALYANIPILNIKNEARKIEKKEEEIKADNKKEIEKGNSKKDKKETDKEKEKSEKIEENSVPQEDKTEDKEKEKIQEENIETADKKEEKSDLEDKEEIVEEAKTEEELNQSEKDMQS